MKKIEIAPLATKEDKLEQMVEYLEELKYAFSEFVDECEDDQVDEGVTGLLSEALTALDDALDCMNDALEEEF